MSSPISTVGWYNEADYSTPYRDCPRPRLWHTRDTQTVEHEVADMVYGLIRGLQPQVVLETGTSRGFLAERIAEALDENSWGHLHTYEPDPERYAEATERLSRHKVRVTAHNEPSMQPWEWEPIEFAWFDSLINLRVREFEFYREHMHPRCVIGFHDTAPRFGSWSNQVRSFGMKAIDLPTPRGVILARLAG